MKKWLAAVLLATLIALPQFVLAPIVATVLRTPLDRTLARLPVKEVRVGGLAVTVPFCSICQTMLLHSL